jgi:hypothetical protein
LPVDRLEGEEGFAASHGFGGAIERGAGGVGRRSLEEEKDSCENRRHDEPLNGMGALRATGYGLRGKWLLVGRTVALAW